MFYRFAWDHPLVQTPSMAWCGWHEIFYRDNGFQCFSYYCSKILMSYQTTWAMARLNVVGYAIVNNKFLTSLHNPNWNWFMNVTLSHEMLHANYMNSNSYIVVRWGHWWNDHNLFIDVCSLFEFPKVALNSSK